MKSIIALTVILVFYTSIYSQEFDFSPITLDKKTSNEPVDFTREYELPQEPAYVKLRRKLKDYISDNYDHYDSEYSNSNGQTRYPVLREQERNYLLIDNLKFHVSRQNGKISWSSALIDLDKIESAVMVKNRFLIRAGEMELMLGHLQVLYKFEPGGVLTRFGQVGGLYISYDIHYKDGEKYDPLIKGMTNQYNTVLQIGTQRQLFLDKLESAGLELIHLDLSVEQVQDLFKISLEHAIRKDEISQNRYHTLHNSCITYQFDLLSETLGKKIHTYHPNLIADELDKHDLLLKIEQVEAPDGIRNYVSKHFNLDAGLELEPTDMVFRAGVGRSERPIKPFVGINF